MNQRQETRSRGSSGAATRCCCPPSSQLRVTSRWCSPPAPDPSATSPSTTGRSPTCKRAAVMMRNNALQRNKRMLLCVVLTAWHVFLSELKYKEMVNYLHIFHYYRHKSAIYVRWAGQRILSGPRQDPRIWLPEDYQIEHRTCWRICPRIIPKHHFPTYHVSGEGVTMP